MPDNYQLLQTAAGKLQVAEQTLLEFDNAGWISVTTKQGHQFISGHDAYRARFILHLRKKLELTNEQIGVVLSHEEPPYSLDKVASILAQHSAAN